MADLQAPSGEPPAPLARPGQRSRGLSTLLQRSIVLLAALAMGLFAAPLAVAVQGLYRAEAFAGLAGDAERTHAQVTTGLGDGDPQGRPAVTVDLPTPRSEHAVIGVYDLDGVLLGGSGPAHAEDLIRSTGERGVEQQAQLGGRLVVAVPVDVGDDGTRYVVRAAASVRELRAHTYGTWALMAGLAGAVLLVVAAVARARARRVARPLQSLAAAADALGHGDFSIRTVPAGIAEVDAVSENLERTARRLGGVLERERAFTADASHQLRTPLTAVRIGLESALLTPGSDLREAAQEALAGLDRLERTVLDLLALARDTGGLERLTDVGELVADVAGPWGRTLDGLGRRLRVDVEVRLPRAAVSQPALRTVLDVLLDNAVAHGAGVVTLRVWATDDTVLVEVGDEGPGVGGDPSRIFARRSADARGTGIGLSLARTLVEADGGRLELTRAVPATFTLLLPAGPEPDQARPTRDAGGGS